MSDQPDHPNSLASWSLPVREALHAGAVWYGGAEATWIVGMIGGSVADGIRTETGRIRSIIAGRHSSAVR